MLTMLRDRVLVKPIVRSLSSIIEVKNTEKFNLGTVIAVGPGAYNKDGEHMPMDVKPGDTVRWGEFEFSTYVKDGEKYTILQEADIAAVVEE